MYQTSRTVINSSRHHISFGYYGESIHGALTLHHLQPERNSVDIIQLLSVHKIHAFSEAHLGQLYMGINDMQTFDLSCECVNAFLNSAL